MDERYITDLLKRFIENNLSDEEYLQLQEIFLDQEAEPIIIKVMDGVWNNPGDAVKFNKLRADRLYKQITDDRRVATSLKSGAFLGKRSFHWIKIAASVLLFCMLAAAGKSIFFNKTGKVAYTTYKTAAGKRLQVRLPDGSRVWLNAGSHLSFPTKFNDKSRDIQLDGEAFFDVVHEAKRPFRVYTRYVCTQVLGTAFDISSYKKETVEVTVVRGLVSVHTHGVQLGLLKPNEQLDYNATNNTVAEHTVDAENYISWIDDDLLLNNISLSEASVIISRRFHVNMILKNPQLKKCRFVASFPANVKLNQVLKVLSRLNNFKYQVVKRDVLISGEGCGNDSK